MGRYFRHWYQEEPYLIIALYFSNMLLEWAACSPLLDSVPTCFQYVKPSTWITNLFLLSKEREHGHCDCWQQHCVSGWAHHPLLQSKYSFVLRRGGSSQWCSFWLTQEEGLWALSWWLVKAALMDYSELLQQHWSQKKEQKGFVWHVTQFLSVANGERELSPEWQRESVNNTYSMGSCCGKPCLHCLLSETRPVKAVWTFNKSADFNKIIQLCVSVKSLSLLFSAWYKKPF